MSVRRAAVLLALAAGLVAALVVGATVSVWSLVLVPFLAAGMYATFLGLTPRRFAEALDDGTGTSYPF